MRKWSAALVVLALALAACGGAARSPATETPGAARPPGWRAVRADYGVTDSEIRLGHRNALTGAQAVFAPSAYFLEAYVRKVNDEGGICGRSLRLIVEDHQNSPAKAMQDSIKLVEADQVLATMGDLGSVAIVSTLEYMNQRRVPQLFVTLGIERALDPDRYPYTITFTPTFAADARIMARLVNERFPGRTVGILYQNDDSGRDALDGFKATFQGRIVAEQSYEATAPELTSQLANLRAAAPDVLVALTASPTFTAQVFRYMAGSGWRPQVVMSSPNTPSVLARLVGDGNPEVGYRQLAGAILNVYTLEPTMHRNTPELQSLADLSARYGAPPVQPPTIFIAAAAELTMEALRRACQQGDMTREGVLRAARTISDFHPSTLWPGITVTLGPRDPFSIEALQPVEVQADGTLRALTPGPVSGSPGR